VAELRLDKTRTNIGRSSEVVRSGGIFRRNDLAFGEESEIDRSVSREHAHIIRDKSAGEYRLFTDRSYTLGTQSSSTWVVRDGMSQEVNRNGRGTKLEFGDEIHFGEAVVFLKEANPLRRMSRTRRASATTCTRRRASCQPREVGFGLRDGGRTGSTGRSETAR
jgi:hypothetical protein